MSSATGLKRLSLVIAAVFAAGIAALVAASALIPTATVRSAVIAEIRAVTGLEPTIRGEVKVSLFPTAMVSFSDDTLGEPGADPALTADRLTAKLMLLQGCRKVSMSMAVTVAIIRTCMKALAPFPNQENE